MKTITRGNYFRKSYTLTEDTRIEGGNFILCQVDPNGYTLTIAGGNVRGLKGPDGVQINPAAPPAWLIVEKSWVPYPYTWQRFEPHPQVLAIFDAIREKAGAEGAFVLEEGVLRAIKTGWNGTYNPATMTPAQWTTGYNTWATANGILTAADKIQAWVSNYLGGMSWTDLRAWVLAKSAATLRGEPTEVVEEYN